MNINGTQGFKWIELVKSTFDEIGLSFMYYDQQYGSADCFSSEQFRLGILYWIIGVW
jgi:hypothetical protein